MKNDELIDSLIEYSKNGRYPFHMPGHKRNVKLLAGMDPFDMDITEIDGFDNLHHAQGILKDTMERARAFYGTKRTWFLVNGSTCGLLAAISAVTEIGDTILMGRNCHKSVYHAVKLRNLKAEYIYPELIEEYGIHGGYDPEKIKELLEENKQIRVVILTSPTYDGIVSDIHRIAEIVHEREGILIVDEAHGAHFGLCDKTSVPAYKMGADIVIESLHKTLPAMTQAAVLHLMGNRVQEECIEEYLGVFETSSPSYVLMASIDQCISRLIKSGKKDMEKLLRRMQQFRKEAEGFQHIRIPGRELIGRHAVFDVDEAKLILDVSRTNITGKELSEILRADYGLELEMEALTYALAICTICDDYGQLERFVDCLRKIDETLERKAREHFSFNLLKNEVECSIYGALLRKSKAMELEEAEGCVSTEFVYAYPPGIPLVVPGEKISKELIRQIHRMKDCGLNINGLADKENEVIKVVI